MLGVLTFASARERGGWPETLVKRLRLVAEVFANAIARARGDQALRESRERYALAVEGANDGLWDWDMLTNEAYFSPRWKGMLGYQDHEVANRFSAWEGLLHPEDRDRASSVLQAYLSIPLTNPGAHGGLAGIRLSFISEFSWPGVSSMPAPS
jgi:PAS domain-containing protein